MQESSVLNVYTPGKDDFAINPPLSLIVSSPPSIVSSAAQKEASPQLRDRLTPQGLSNFKESQQYQQQTNPPLANPTSVKQTRVVSRFEDQKEILPSLSSHREDAVVFGTGNEQGVGSSSALHRAPSLNLGPAEACLRFVDQLAIAFQTLLKWHIARTEHLSSVPESSSKTLSSTALNQSNVRTDSSVEPPDHELLGKKRKRNLPDKQASDTPLCCQATQGPTFSPETCPTREKPYLKHFVCECSKAFAYFKSYSHHAEHCPAHTKPAMRKTRNVCRGNCEPKSRACKGKPQRTKLKRDPHK